jgi:hypothetical protein
MPLRFPPRSVYGGRTINAHFPDSIPTEGDQSKDPTSVRFRIITEIMLRGIRRCVAEDRDLERTSNTEEPVLGNLGDSSPEPLDFVSDKALSVSHASKTLGLGDAQDTQIRINLSWTPVSRMSSSRYFSDCHRREQGSTRQAGVLCPN